jgi:hypothetical protein
MKEAARREKNLKIKRHVTQQKMLLKYIKTHNKYIKNA